jgi:hypothetical protein
MPLASSDPLTHAAGDPGGRLHPGAASAVSLRGPLGATPVLHEIVEQDTGAEPRLAAERGSLFLGCPG